MKLTGTHLAQQVYAMITYMQSTQNQNIQEQTQNGKNKSKDRKKANLAGKVIFYKYLAQLRQQWIPKNPLINPLIH